MNCIVNVDEKWGIGREGALLVAISDDLQRFRRLTVGKTVVLGRKTLATFPGGRPLKNRRNIILSRDPEFSVEGAESAASVGEVLKLLREVPPEDICIIGGASIYEAFLPYCRTAQVTRTMMDGGADRFFPNLDRMEGWEAAVSSPVLEENGIRYQYIDYVNQNPLPF